MVQAAPYVSDSPCERGELILEQSGFGTGDVVELDPGRLPAGFVTLELADEGEVYDSYYGHYHYYNASPIEFALENLSGPTEAH